MPSPYSLDLRVRIVAAYEDGMSVDELAEQFRVGRSTIYTYLNQFQETGNVAPKVYQPGRKKKLAPYEAEVRQLVADYPDATLADFCEKLSPQVSVSTATMCEFLRYLKITRKKNSSCRRTTSRRCRQTAKPMAMVHGYHRHEKTCFHR